MHPFQLNTFGLLTYDVTSCVAPRLLDFCWEGCLLTNHSDNLVLFELLGEGKVVATAR
jgi:hypothetical protein